MGPLILRTTLVAVVELSRGGQVMYGYSGMGLGESRPVFLVHASALLIMTYSLARYPVTLSHNGPEAGLFPILRNPARGPDVSLSPETPPGRDHSEGSGIAAWAGTEALPGVMSRSWFTMVGFPGRSGGVTKMCSTGGGGNAKVGCTPVWRGREWLGRRGRQRKSLLARSLIEQLQICKAANPQIHKSTPSASGVAQAD